MYGDDLTRECQVRILDGRWQSRVHPRALAEYFFDSSMRVPFCLHWMYTVFGPWGSFSLGLSWNITISVHQCCVFSMRTERCFQCTLFEWDAVKITSAQRIVKQDEKEGDSYFRRTRKLFIFWAETLATWTDRWSGIHFCGKKTVKWLEEMPGTPTLIIWEKTRNASNNMTTNETQYRIEKLFARESSGLSTVSGIWYLDARIPTLERYLLPLLTKNCQLDCSF